MTVGLVSSTSSAMHKYTQTTNDVVLDTPQTARALGTLSDNTNMLTVNSALVAADKVDNFAFKILPGTNLTDVGIASSSNGGNVRIKIMNQLGSRAIADSGADPLSSAGQAYAAMQKGTLSLPAGKYVVQVTRANDTLDSAKPNYTVQLSAGKSKNDYVTNEYVVDPNAPVNPNVQSSNLAAALTSLPPDGTQTTDIFTQTSMAGNYAGLNTYA